MDITKLTLTNFRNYSSRDFTFGPKIHAVSGPNTTGKTNLLEAIYLIASGVSFREGKIEEMINWSSETAHVEAIISHLSPPPSPPHPVTTQLQVRLTRGIVQGKKVSKRRYLVNDVARLRPKFIGHFTAICFRPEDMRIIEGSPTRRRNFLDDILLQLDPAYTRAQAAYSQGLVRRNRLLQMIREGQINRTSLAFWDQLIIKHGTLIQQQRQQLSEFFNRHLLPNSQPDSFFNYLKLKYFPSVISSDRLSQYQHQEIAAGHTLVGPHRDDFSVISRNHATEPVIDPSPLHPLAHGRDLSTYGSRGEQRLGVLWLKLMAMEFMESQLKFRPTLLLDDIFSELDHDHRTLVWHLCQQQQTIITTAEPEFIRHFQSKLDIITL